MKRIFYALAFLWGVSEAQAQENRGSLIRAKLVQHSIMVGGSLSGAYRSIEDHSSATTTNNQSGSKKQIDFNGRFGYLVLNDLAIGGLGVLSHTNLKMEDTSPSKSTHILIGPFARYFLNNGLFGEASYSFGINNLSSNIKKDISEVRGGVGYALFINHKVALEPAVMFSYYKEKNAAVQDSYFTEFGPSLTIGLQVYLYR